LNESYLNSGIPLNVSFEDNTLFGFQTKTLLGLRADYKISDNFNVGATIMKLYERPFTQKVNIGDDPINNNIYGGDIQYTTEAPWLTRAVDAIPLIQTKAPSQISFTAEAAYLDPGHANAISQEDQGVVYVDDFEGSTSSLDLRIPANAWTLASIPQDPLGSNNLFPESALVDTTLSGVNRAKLSWYQIDQTGVDSEVEPNAYTETVLISKIFPTISLTNGSFNSILRTLDLTYYPDERGPYNFDLPEGGTQYSAGLGASGELLEPETRWAGIQRELTTNNFEAANVEYIEFWMLSPFLNGDDGEESNVGDGEFYINLGNISEDVLRDSRLFFENGLPGQDDLITTDETNWSRIPRARAVTRSFDNDPVNRALQDVGLDGYDDAGESILYQEYLTAIEAATMQTVVKDAILADPANDNFKYYNDDSFDAQDDIFERYYSFNNPEGNSREAGQQVSSATNIPDTEDINKDNTLNETEAYFQYKIPINRVSPTSEEVELNDFIVESVVTEGDERIWYRVKVPVEQYTSRVGGIQDFRSIRFIRMFMTKFDEQTTLRFARFELVRNQWRRYTRSLADAGIGTVIDEGDDTVFDVNDVNVEENSAKEPFNYVLPNGVVREQQIGSAFADALQNEQSLAINVCNLKDGDGRGIFKNLNLDIRLFKELRMFVHAEESNDDQIEDGEMTLFMRLGSDFEKNYYEYEIPLSMTREIPDGASAEEYADLVWPEINELKLKLELLQAVKTERNTTNSALNFLYTIQDPEFPDHTVGVKGNPNLGLVKSVMIGVRNKEDDGLSHCAEIWLNELRMSGFDERGGWGALARLDIQMADFANLNVSTNYTSVGFGGLEQKLIQRSREEMIQYDIATNIELGKFLPEKSGVKIPFYAQYSNTIKNPQYDPYDLDIELKDKLAAAPDRATRDEIKKRAQDNTKIKSINLTNVRKERTNTTKKPRPWDIENLSVTYAFSETDRSTPTIARDNLRDNQGILDYTYSTKANYITPFKKVVKKKNVAKYLKFFTDFNFNPYPNGFSFSTRMHRQFQSTTYRFSDEAQATYFDKKFTWDRSYDLKWDLSKSLKLNFNAINNGVIDEPNGAIDQIAKDSIWSNVKNWGRNKDYQHNVNVTFNVPLKNFPFLDFMKVKAQYNANYGWQAGALNLIGEDDIDLGNIIRNGNTRQINGDLDFVTLYNKSKFLKKINSKSRKGGKSSGNRAQKLSAGKSKKGAEDEEGKKKKKDKDKEPSVIAKALIRPLMMIRKAKFTYSEQYSSVIPGFTPDHNLLGQDKGFSAPGWDYIFGWRQPDEAWLQKNQNWITESIFLNQQILGSKTQDINARLTIEPFNDFRIELEADKKESRNNTSYFKKVDAASDFEQLAYREVGSYQISYYTLGTMFQSDYFALFEQFQNNREIISQRLAAEAGITAEHDTDNIYGDYYEGYGRYQLDVLIPSFLAAYSGKTANNVKLNVFKTIPLPNWRISYKGLSKIKGFDKIFSSVSLNHSYKSGLNVNSFNTETDRDGDSPFAKNPNTDNYYSEFEIPNLVISEQLSPLIGVDMRFKNGLTTKLDWKKSRNLAMGFTDYQLSETRSEEFVIGVGYRLKNVYIKFLDFGDLDGKKIKGKIDEKKGKKDKDDPKAGGTSKDKKGSDMNFKFDFSWRDDVTVNHLLDQGVSIPTRGMKTVRISPSIDYAVNKQLNLRLFYDFSRTIPATSASFPITNTSAGLQIRFSLN
jgi:cell surface protein SprA